MKSYTDLKQSKKLTKILPLESADMRYGHIAPYETSVEKYDGGYEEIPHSKDFLTKHPYVFEDEYDSELPCWSLAALLDIIPDNIEIDGHRWGLSIRKNSISYLGSMTWDGQLNISVQGDNLVDACYEMINKLHELNLL